MAIVVIGAVVKLSAQSKMPHHKSSTVHCHKKHKAGRHHHKHSASESKAQKAGEFNGDLRDIPPGKTSSPRHSAGQRTKNRSETKPHTESERKVIAFKAPHITKEWPSGIPSAFSRSESLK